MYTVSICDTTRCRSQVSYVNLVEAAQFLYGPRESGERVFVKYHGDKGTRYITYQTLRDKIRDYLKKNGLTINDLYA